MKIVFVLVFLIAAFSVNAQTSPAAAVADKIAQKMKDSLDLTASQKEQIYQVNMQLHETKMQRRQQYGGTDSVRFYVQRVENTRDSLYRPILGEEKYQLYRQKKSNLVNNN